MHYVINFPDATFDQLRKLHDTVKKFEKLDDATFNFLFMNVKNFQIIDLEKGIMYSWDGQHALVQPT